jgi:hypothetical protein
MTAPPTFAYLVETETETQPSPDWLLPTWLILLNR